MPLAAGSNVDLNPAWTEQEVPLPPHRRRTYPASDLGRPPKAFMQASPGQGPEQSSESPSNALKSEMRLHRGRVVEEDSPTLLKISALDLMSKEFYATSRSSLARPPSLPLVANDKDKIGDKGWEPGRPPAFDYAASSLGSCPDDEELLVSTHPNSFRSSIQFCVTIGQFFSVLPTSAQISGAPRFNYLSLRVFFWAIVTFGLVLNTILTIVDVMMVETPNKSAITVSSRWMFYLSASTVSILYFRLAIQWRCLCLFFLRAEHRMRDYGYPPKLRCRMRAVTTAVLTLALVEYLLAITSGAVAMDFDNKTLSEIFKDYFYGNYSQMLLLFEYNPFLLFIAQTLNTVGTFMWNFNDLFVMLISVAVAQRFKLLNNKLTDSPIKDRSPSFWKNAREKYNALSNLTREVDELLSVQILFSFMNNLYFICIQLLNTVEHEENTIVKNIYFTFSFGFLLMRTVFVSLFAASINDESKKVKKILYSVSSRSFCEEVDRFLIQATTDEISLTGLKFFNVTRSFLLTMAGTIATYEVVLVQFNGNKKAEAEVPSIPATI